MHRVIEIRQLSLRYGPQVVFDGVSAVLGPHERIGLAGRNGAGKSTLLKVILGQVEGDAGEVVRSKGATVGYLPQDGLECHGQGLVEAVMEADTETMFLLRAVEAAHQRLEAMPAESTAEAVLQEQETLETLRQELEHREGDRLRAKAEKVLNGLGFRPEDMNRDTSVFSGGWQMRIALAKLLLQQPRYLLLDEPTNHLDLPSQRWLEGYLGKYPGALVLISHDRAFLDLLTQKTFALSRGRLEIYAGNYTYFEKEREHRREVLRARQVVQEKQLEKTQEFIDRFRFKATKARQVQSRIKALDKVERIEVEEEEEALFFRFAPAPPSGRMILEMEGMHKSYGDLRLFRGFNLRLERTQRLAVVGVNGAGKSTLMRILAGEEAADAGRRTLGDRAQPGYFAQHQADRLNPDWTVFEAALEGTGTSEQQARNVLGMFLFSGDMALKRVRVLSGGERNRLALARMLLKPANFLLMDEPTNHLDIQSKAILQEALKSFDGGFMIVSHDRDFLDPLVQHVLEINPAGHQLHFGNISDYLAKVEAAQSGAGGGGQGALSRLPAGGAGKGPGSGEESGESARERRRREAELRQRLAPLRKRVAELEAEVEAVDARIAAWEERMKSPEFFAGRAGLKDDLQAYEGEKRRQERAMEAWEEAVEELEKAEKGG